MYFYNSFGQQHQNTMHENTIAVRIYDFLKDYPPFNLVEKKQLLEQGRTNDEMIK